MKSQRSTYVVLDDAGLVRRAGSVAFGRPMPEGALEVVLVGVEDAPTWTPGGAQVGALRRLGLSALGAMMRVGHYLVSRPKSPQPTAEPGCIVIPACPAGTEVEVFDLAGAELMAFLVAEDDGFAEVVEFPDPGTYEVEVRAPAPALPTTARVVIS